MVSASGSLPAAASAGASARGGTGPRWRPTPVEFGADLADSLGGDCGCFLPNEATGRVASSLVHRSIGAAYMPRPGLHRHSGSCRRHGPCHREHHPYPPAYIQVRGKALTQCLNQTVIRAGDYQNEHRTWHAAKHHRLCVDRGRGR